MASASGNVKHLWAMRKAALAATSAKIFTTIKVGMADTQAASLTAFSLPRAECKPVMPLHPLAGGYTGGNVAAPTTNTSLMPSVPMAALTSQRLVGVQFTHSASSSHWQRTQQTSSHSWTDGRITVVPRSVTIAAYSTASASASGSVSTKPEGTAEHEACPVDSSRTRSKPSSPSSATASGRPTSVHSTQLEGHGPAQSADEHPEELKPQAAASEAKTDAGADASTTKGSSAGGMYWHSDPGKQTRDDGSPWPWKSFRPVDSYHAVHLPLDKHFKPTNFGDVFAKYLVKALRIPTDLFFRKRYGCRAMMLETVAAVPGMSAGMLLHLKSLRLVEPSGGWIRTLLEEAENERMHLMTFMHVSKPKWYERALIFAVQAVFFTAYTTAYIISPRVAHRVVGYLEEEAIHSYTQFLKEIDAGRIENVPAPAIAIDYWRLPKDARLREVVVAVRADEAHHRDVNHYAASVVACGEKLKDNPAPVDKH